MAIATPSWVSPQKKMKNHFLYSAPTAERTHGEDERVNPVTTGVGDAPRGKMFGKTKLYSLRYVSYSIPLACIMTLISMPQNMVYAADCGMAPAEGYEYVGTGCSMAPILTPTEEFTVQVGDVPTASLSIDGKTSVVDSIKSIYGQSNYASHTVSVNVTGAESYDLILSGPAQLSGPTTINATKGATGANLASDTWGYAWENTSITNENANYKALSSSIKLTGNALSNQATSFSKKLTFAAKFDKASAGTYHADVSLSLVATPKITTVTVNAVPWNKLVFMQDMTKYACMQAKVGDSKTLTDVRDNNTYTIAKLSNNQCWMTQNLRLSRETIKNVTYAGTYSSPMSLTSSDTNLESTSYDLPSSVSSFAETDPQKGQIKKYENSTYGTYYSFNAATAGTATSLETDGKSASNDICPKGWHLSTYNDFNSLITISSTKAGTDADWAKGSTTSGYWLGGTSIANGGSFFSTNGYFLDNGLNWDGLAGHYWTSIVKDASLAYGISFGKSGSVGASTGSRFRGLAVRCVAR